MKFSLSLTICGIELFFLFPVTPPKPKHRSSFEHTRLPGLVLETRDESKHDMSFSFNLFSLRFDQVSEITRVRVITRRAYQGYRRTARIFLHPKFAM